MPGVVDLAAMRDAVKRAGRRPRRINPLVPADLVIDHSVQVDPFGTIARLRRSTSSASTSATASATRCCAGRSRPSRTSASSRRAPASSIRSIWSIWRKVVHDAQGARRRDARLPRYAGRHRLAHHHDQRPGRAGLGRRRHRGRGGDAGPAALPADARGRRHAASRARCRRARRPPIWCSPSRRCCASTAWSGKFVEFCGAGPERAEPRRPRHASPTCPPSTAPRRRSSRSTTRRCATCALTGREPSLVDLVERYYQGAGPLPHRRHARPEFTELLELDLAHHRAEPGRAEPPAGPRGAERRCSDNFRHLRPGCISQGRSAGDSGAQSVEGADGDEPSATPHGRTVDDRMPAAAMPMHATARSSSRRSPAAPTPRIPSVMLGAGLLAKKAVERGLQRQARTSRPAWPPARASSPTICSAAGLMPYLEALVPPRRLRLHDLHRQQRPAAGADRAGDRGERPGRRRGAQRQPQLRGAHPPAGARRLSRLAAAGGRLCAGRHASTST